MEDIPDQKDQYEMCEVGDFDFIRVKNCNCAKGYMHQKLTKERSAQEKPRPFLEQLDNVSNGVGGGDGRVWISYPGNLHGVIGIPTYMLKDDVAVEFFPILASNAIVDTCNYYAPGQYIKKFPNDIVCTEHMKKTGGTLFRKEDKFCLCIFTLNFVQAPPDDLLRKEGLRACCFKEHMQTIPDMKEFYHKLALRILELCNKEFDTVEKIIKNVNETHNKFSKKKFRLELNNPNADLKKDGALWTTKCPNALTKGYINDDEYEFLPTFYDTVYYKTEGNADWAKEYELKTAELKKKKMEESKKEKGE